MYQVLLNKIQILAWLCLLVAGCASLDPVPLENPKDPLLDVFELNRRVVAEKSHQPPPEVSNLLLPDLNSPPDLEKQEQTESRFAISVHQADAREFFMGLVAYSEYNMIVHPDVRGTISINLKNVTIVEVLEAIREVYGYEFKRMDVGFIVFPVELQTRIFHINYLDLIRNGVSETRITSGQISDADSAGSQSSGSNRSGETSRITGSLIETKSKSDFWKELRTALAAIVGSKEGGSAVVNPQSGVLVVKAMPSTIREVERFLAVTQNRIQKQVILEAKILEVRLNDGFQSGINWATLIRLGSNAITLGQTGGGTLLNRGLSEISGNSGNLNPGNFTPVSTNDTSAFGGAFTTVFDFNNFKSLIELLETQGKVHTLSSPRISTMNNQKAIIKVGSDEYFVTDVSTTTVNGVSAQTNADITLTPFFSGIALDVTPQIDDDLITLHVHPSVTQVVNQNKVITIGGAQQDLPLALSTVRESDSIVRAKSGQIVVIGGLMQDVDRSERAGTPWLGTLPFIGPLFRHSREESRKSELVILLKPLVIDGNDGWNRSVKDIEQRFRSLHNGGT